MTAGPLAPGPLGFSGNFVDGRPRERLPPPEPRPRKLPESVQLGASSVSRASKEGTSSLDLAWNVVHLAEQRKVGLEHRPMRYRQSGTVLPQVAPRTHSPQRELSPITGERLAAQKPRSLGGALTSPLQFSPPPPWLSTAMKEITSEEPKEEPSVGAQGPGSRANGGAKVAVFRGLGEKKESQRLRGARSPPNFDSFLIEGCALDFAQEPSALSSSNSSFKALAPSSRLAKSADDAKEKKSPTEDKDGSSLPTLKDKEVVPPPLLRSARCVPPSEDAPSVSLVPSSADEPRRAQVKASEEAPGRRSVGSAGAASSLGPQSSKRAAQSDTFLEMEMPSQSKSSCRQASKPREARQREASMRRSRSTPPSDGVLLATRQRRSLLVHSKSAFPMVAGSGSAAVRNRKSRKMVLPFTYALDDPRYFHVESSEGRIFPEFHPSSFGEAEDGTRERTGSLKGSEV